LLKREWIRAPDLVPASFEIVSARGRAVELLQKLRESFLAPVLDRVLQIHAVPRVGLGAFRQKQEAQLVESAESSESHADEKVTDAAPEPLLTVVPEARDSRLPPKKLEWLIQVLMLRRAPAEVRTSSFQRRLERWIALPATLRSGVEAVAIPAAQKSVAVPDGVTTLPSSVESAGGEPAVAQGQRIPDSVGEISEVEASPSRFSVTAPRPLSSVRAPPAVEAAQILNDARVAGIKQHATMESAGQIENGSSREEVISDITPVASPETRARRLERPNSIAPRVATAFGGAMFLLNVFLYLKLYGDFSSPLASGLELNIWDLLSLLGARFGGPEFEEDPLSDVLAALAGRSKEEKPRFDPPSDWSMPPEWLEPFPEGFEWTEGDGDPMERWLSGIAAYIRARLSRAIGRDDAAEFLCCIPARLEINPAHVDVYFELNRYPVELRLAGLDRDPGWIPAAGRYVAFHFD